MDLVIENVIAGYRGTNVVNGVHLRVDPGVVVAIVGPNGCGKSTLLRVAARLHKPTAGKVLAGGEDIWKLRARQAAHRVALLPQSPQAPSGVTVAGLAAYGRHPHQGLLRQWSLDDERVVHDALVATGMTEFADRQVDRLSGGQRQRAWIAMVLAQQAPMMLLDEPTSALDLGHQVEVLHLMRDVAASGHSVVTVLHDLVSAARYADVLVAMREGKVVASGKPDEIVDSSLVRRLYDVDAEILRASSDGSPVVIAERSANREVPSIQGMSE